MSANLMVAPWAYCLVTKRAVELVLRKAALSGKVLVESTGDQKAASRGEYSAACWDCLKVE